MVIAVTLRPAATVVDPDSGRVLGNRNDSARHAALHGQSSAGNERSDGHGGHEAFCLETQHYPNAPNRRLSDDAASTGTNAPRNDHSSVHGPARLIPSDHAHSSTRTGAAGLRLSPADPRPAGCRPRRASQISHPPRCRPTGSSSTERQFHRKNVPSKRVLGSR